MRGFSQAAAAILAAATLCATTLQQLSLTEMIQQSTAIVRGKVARSLASYRGADLYTHYQIDVLETLKGGTGRQVDLAVPGGYLNGVHQTVAGAPQLVVGQEYVVFLWTGKSGMTQAIGLSQGLFSVRVDAGGNTVLVRPGAGEPMLDASGRLVKDQPFSIALSELRARIAQVLGGGK
jgi:hypothetical protein